VRFALLERAAFALDIVPVAPDIGKRVEHPY
jgi:hypothetical protein